MREDFDFLLVSATAPRVPFAWPQLLRIEDVLTVAILTKHVSKTGRPCNTFRGLVKCQACICCTIVQSSSQLQETDWALGESCYCISANSTALISSPCESHDVMSLVVLSLVVNSLIISLP